MNWIIWDYCEMAGKLGLLHAWAAYTRKYPERFIITASID
jgi:hypothetical protein